MTIKYERNTLNIKNTITEGRNQLIGCVVRIIVIAKNTIYTFKIMKYLSFY